VDIPGGRWQAPRLVHHHRQPVLRTTDAIMALDMDTGEVRWSVQTLAKDVWHLGCPQVVPGLPNRGVRPGYPPDNCPEKPGPDWDYAASPILAKTTSGRELIIAAQKPGWIFALDPDRKGAIVWETDVARGVRGGGGEIVFGGAVDGQNVYYGIHTGGLVAVDLTTGVEKWFRQLKPTPGMEKHPGIIAAPSMTSGVIFAGGMDGMVRAFAPFDGNVLWEFDTAREFQTANEVKAKGGSIGLGGPIVAGGMVFVGSGHVGFQGGAPGNLLLAFSSWETKK
jgi:polyvinyl alcohol dehydrogenase (cytochrome)